MSRQSTGDKPLAGRRALITGAGNIATSVGRWLAADGAEVTFFSRTESRVQEATDAVEADVPGAKVRYLVGDAVDEGDTERAVEAASEGPDGTLDILVTTVGGATFKPLLATDVESFQADIASNLLSPFISIRRATPAMVRAGGGAIVCISTVAAVKPVSLQVSYSAAKAGLEQLIKVAAVELGPLGIRVNGVRPGMTPGNERTRAFMTPQTMERFSPITPLARLTGTGDDMAAAVHYLAGPTSSWVTGQCFSVDGGMELGGYPDTSDFARERWGAALIDTALRGEIPVEEVEA